MSYRIAAWGVALGLSLHAQVADSSFFLGDPVQVMLTCADRAEDFRRNDSRLLAERGRAYLAAGQRARAQELFDAAERSDPYDPTTNRLIAEAWLRYGDPAPVALQLRKALEIAQRRLSPLHEFGPLLVRFGMAAEGRRMMTRAWNLDHEWEAAFEYGEACLQAGLSAEAAQWFYTGVKVHPSRPAVWHTLANILAASAPLPSEAVQLPVLDGPREVPRDLSPAWFLQDPRVVMVRCADMARPAKEREATLWAEDGAIRLRAGDLAGATTLFERAVKEDPEDGEVRLVIGTAWLRHGDVPKALAAFNELFRKAPGDRDALMTAAVSLLKAGQDGAASEFMERGDALPSENFTLPMAFAQTALAKGRPDWAARWFARCLELAPRDWRAWNDVSLGIADLRLGAKAPVPQPPSSRRLWLKAGFPIDLTAPLSKDVSVQRVFQHLYPDLEGFRSEVLAQMRAACPQALPWTPEAKPDPEDRILSLEVVRPVEGVVLEDKRVYPYMEILFCLAIADGRGKVLQRLNFRESGELERGLRLPQTGLAGQVPKPERRMFPEALRAARARLAAFLTSPAFPAWAD